MVKYIMIYFTYDKGVFLSFKLNNKKRKWDNMIILGIDPGLAIIGYGVVEYKNSRFRTIDYGAITTPAGMPTVERLDMIYRGMNQLFHKIGRASCRERV